MVDALKPTSPQPVSGRPTPPAAPEPAPEPAPAAEPAAVAPATPAAAGDALQATVPEAERAARADPLGQLYQQVGDPDAMMSDEEFDAAVAGDDPPAAPSPAPPAFRKVESDPANSDVKDSGSDAATAAALASVVAEARAALTPAQQAQFDQVQLAASDNPRAQVALARMLLNGDLPGSKPNAEGQDTLAALAALAGQETKEPLDAKQLMQQVLIEVQNPAAINQGPRGTCSATAAQILTAKADPAEYARLISGLASPAGEVAMRNGETLRREEGTQQATDMVDEKGGTVQDWRTDTARLFGPAAMEYANGADRDYDNRTDRHSSGQTEPGLSMGENAQLETALTGQNSTGRGVPNADPERKAYFDRLAGLASEQRPIQAAIRYGRDAADPNANHQVVVTRMDANQVDYINPWGQKESMTRAEFEKRIYAATLPDA